VKYSVLLDRLQNLTKRKISQSELCNILGLKQSAMGNRQSRDSNFSDLEIKTIEHHYNVILSEQSELIEIEHIHINPSCGFGTVVIDEPDITPVKLGKKMIENILRVSSPDNLKTFTASGDSMTDTIDDSNVLLVDMGRTDYQNGGVFLLQKDNDWFVKRLRLRMTGELDIISDNTKYPIETFKPEDAVSIVVRGRVIKNLSKGL
jgi:phage repressor protein C with HTH and peptisase S24 domain